MAVPKRIISEDQARRIGEFETGGCEGRDFTIFWYKDQRTKITMFGVTIIANHQDITTTM